MNNFSQYARGADARRDADAAEADGNPGRAAHLRQLGDEADARHDATGEALAQVADGHARLRGTR